MKTFKFFLAVGLMLLGNMNLIAQEVDITKGDLSFLKGETSINIVLTYDKMSVGDFNKEADYIKKRIEELNTKEAGTGDSWVLKWEDNKKTLFVEKFILGFTKQNKLTISADAKYTLIFNTKALEPGYQVGISKRNAGVDGTVTIVETAKPEKKLAVLYVERAPETKWRGAAFDAASRIGDAYFMNAQKIGKFITKNSK